MRLKRRPEKERKKVFSQHLGVYDGEPAPLSFCGNVLCIAQMMWL